MHEKEKTRRLLNKYQWESGTVQKDDMDKTSLSLQALLQTDGTDGRSEQKRALYGGSTVRNTLDSNIIIYGFSKSQWCKEFREHIFDTLAAKGEHTEKKSRTCPALNPWLDRITFPNTEKRNSEDAHANH